MATTRIMPLHIGKGRTESQAVSDIIDYVSNPQKTDNGRLVTSFTCDSRVADVEFLLAKREYISVTGRVRSADDVLSCHVRQSFVPGEITPEEANWMGVLPRCVILLFLREEGPAKVFSTVLVFCNTNVNMAVFKRCR